MERSVSNGRITAGMTPWGTKFLCRGMSTSRANLAHSNGWRRPTTAVALPSKIGQICAGKAGVRRMATRRLGIIMNGVTGRMGTNQHLVRSILAIRKQGGVTLPNGDRVMPDPILVGRNAEKLAALAREHGVERHTTDLDKALDNKDDEVFFDAASTQLRPDLLERAIDKGKHIYCEKPIADTYERALKAAKLARANKVKNGVVQDKLFFTFLARA